MKVFLPLFALLLAGCQIEAGQEDVYGSGGDAESATLAQNRPGQKTDVPTDCPLTVGFSSYAVGIDRRTLEGVEDLLGKHPDVRAVEHYPWGREGETTLCVRVATPESATQLFHEIKALFPSDPRGPLSVRTSTGLSFQAPPVSQ